MFQAPHRGDEFRGGAAAAAEEGGAACFEGLHVADEVLRAHAVDGFTRLGDRGQARVGLGGDGRITSGPVHHAHDGAHLVRAGRAVDAHGVRAEAGQELCRFLGRAVKIAFSVRIDRERTQNGGLAQAADGLDGGHALGHAHHRLHGEQVDPGLKQRFGLLTVDLQQRLIRAVVAGGDGPAGRGHVAREQRGRAHGLAAELHQIAVERPDLALQVVVAQQHAVGPEGGRVDDLAARGEIGPLQRDQRLRVIQNPGLGADARGHAGPAQHTAGRAVKQMHGFAPCGKFRSCHSSSDRAQHLADGVAEDQVGVRIVWGLIAVDEHELVSAVVADEPRRGVDGQGRAAHDQNLRVRDRADRALDHGLVEAFLVEHHVRLDPPAAGAAGDARAVTDVFGRIEFAAFLAVVAVDRAVQLVDTLAAGLLVQAVDVLGHDGAELAGLFERGELFVRLVRLIVQREHLFTVKLDMNFDYLFRSSYMPV